MLGTLAALAALGAIWFAVVQISRRRAFDPEAALLRSCYGDRDQMERLITRELRGLPGISRAAAAARAFESQRRDNR